jgi:hypothetical protein
MKILKVINAPKKYCGLNHDKEIIKPAVFFVKSNLENT